MAKRKQRLIVEYRGITIWRNIDRPNALRWSALGIGAADTLAGMKKLIRESQG